MNNNTLDKNSLKIAVYVSLYLITIGIFLSIFFLTPNTSYDYPIIRSVIIFFCSILLVKYFFYMLISPWYDVYHAKIRSRSIEGKNKYEPLVSILIPAWNESRGIVRTLETILDSTYNKIELVVINDGSTDDSNLCINEFINKNKTEITKESAIKIKYIYQKNTGKGGALNKAIENSNGEILITIDADCIVNKNTITNFVRHFEDQKVMAAVGNVKVAKANNIISVIQQLEFLFSFYFKKADSLMESIYIIGGAAGAFRRELFDEIGTFNTTNITEDIDISVRIQKSGVKIVYASDAIVYTEGANDFTSLLKQRLRWKRGRFETFIKHRELFFSSDKKHKKILSWIILPCACLAEIQLSMELFFIIFLYVFSFLIHDFSSFIPGIAIVISMFVIQTIFDSTEKKTWSFYLLAPIGWLLFYATTFIEVIALAKSISGLIMGKELKWQKWKRVGI